MKNLQVIKASAGSGKTFTLARIYIERLLWDKNGKLRNTRNYHQHILAITFTNKATDEMKQRIVERLDELSQGTCKAYQKQFLQDHPGTTPEQMKDAAARALEDILFDYQSFNVSTIDSFFQTILRTFAYELDRDDYEVELDGQFVSSLAVQNFLSSLGRGKGTTRERKWIKQLVKKNISENRDGIFFGGRSYNDIFDFAKELSKETFLDRRAEIKEYLSDMGSGEGISRINLFSQKLIEARKTSRESINNFYSETSKILSDANIEIEMIKNSALKKLLQGVSIDDISTATLNTMFNLPNADNPASKMLKKEALAIPGCDEIVEQVCWRINVLAANIKREKALTLFTEKLGLLGLLNQIENQMEHFRKENNAVLISDTTDLIAKVLDSGVPFLYERMGTWLNHFMIDEFQDTSRKQYRNFQPLLENSLSDGNANLIIGDEKQSIYRFRNSDSNLLRTQIAEDFNDFYDDSTKLSTNYRSHANVVKFNNFFFQKLIGHYAEKHPEFDVLQKTYTNLEQSVSSDMEENSVKGNVRLNIVEASGISAGREEVVNALPEYILDLHERLQYPFGKILILVNTHAEGDLVVNQLLAHNNTHPDRHINIVSEESLKLINSPAIRLILSVLSFLDAMGTNESSQLFLNKIVHDFGKKIGAASADANTTQLLLDTLRENDALKAAPEAQQTETYSRLFEKLMPDECEEMMTLEVLVDKIIKEFVESTGATHKGETPFLLAFQNAVSNFCEMRGSGGSIHEFLKFWEAKKNQLVVESSSDADAVEVMTIHAAKGLERACVIIPFASWTLKGRKEMVWLPREVWLHDNSEGAPFSGIKDDEHGNCIVPPIIPVSSEVFDCCSSFASYYNPLLEEQLIDIINKTYVAFTRAGQSLHLFSQVKATSSDKLDSLGDFLKLFMPQLGGDLNNCGCCCFGVEECYQPPKKQQDAEAEKRDEEIPDYYVTSPVGILHVSLPEIVTEQQDSGNRLHRLFSRIRWKKDVDRALRYAKKRRIISTDECHYWNLQRVEAIVDRMFTDERTALWFADDNRVDNERPIFYANRNHEVVTCRPDRVVTRPDGTIIVIDYKFGDAPNEKQREGYEKQVRTYMQHFFKMGHQQVLGYLWYVKEDSITEVKLAQDET